MIGTFTVIGWRQAVYRKEHIFDVEEESLSIKKFHIIHEIIHVSIAFSFTRTYSSNDFERIFPEEKYIRQDL